MDEDALNMAIRRFLKQVGVTSQREIEKAIRDGVAAGNIKPGGTITLTATITGDGLDLAHQIKTSVTLA